MKRADGRSGGQGGGGERSTRGGAKQERRGERRGMRWTTRGGEEGRVSWYTDVHGEEEHHGYIAHDACQHLAVGRAASEHAYG